MSEQTIYVAVLATTIMMMAGGMIAFLRRMLDTAFDAGVGLSAQSLLYWARRLEVRDKASPILFAVRG
ncbi:MAG: hypothetical protein QXH35_05450 [Nitrososphaerota archaeon]